MPPPPPPQQPKPTTLPYTPDLPPPPQPEPATAQLPPSLHDTTAAAEYDGAAGGEVYEAAPPPPPPQLAAPSTTKPPPPPWWAGNTETRRANDAVRDSLLYLDEGNDEFASRAAAWRTERTKLVEGHAALARRLAAEVEAREAIHAKLVEAESRAAIVEAAEKTAADAGTRAEGQQQRIDALMSALDTRDNEVRELQGQMKAMEEAKEVSRAEEAAVLSSLREQLRDQKVEYASAISGQEAAKAEVTRLAEVEVELQGRLNAALAEGRAAVARADAAEEEAAEHEASVERRVEAEGARLATEQERTNELNGQLNAVREQMASAVSAAKAEHSRAVEALEERLADAEGHASHLAKELGTHRGRLLAAQRELEDVTGALAAAEARARISEEAAETRAAEVGRLQASGGLKEADLSALRARLAESDADASTHAAAAAAARAEAEEQRRRADAASVAKSEGEAEWKARAEAATSLAERLERDLAAQQKYGEERLAAAEAKVLATTPEGVKAQRQERFTRLERDLEEMKGRVEAAEAEKAAAVQAAAEATGAAAQAGMREAAAAAEAKAALAEAAAAGEAAAKAATASAAVERAEAAAEAEARAAAEAEAAVKEAKAEVVEVERRAKEAEAKAEAAAANAAESAKRAAAEAKAEAAAERAKLTAQLAKAESRVAEAEAKAEEAEARAVSGMASPPPPSTPTPPPHHDEEATLELRLTVKSQQLELRQSRAAWATCMVHAALSTVWMIRMGAALGAWRAASAAAADGGGVAASPPAAAVEEADADADDGKVLELQTTIHSQQLELRQSRTAWATYSIHAVLSTAWNLRMSAAIGVWRAAAVAVAPSSSVASYAAAPEATRPALAAAEQRANQAEARAAAAEKALAHNEYESTGEDKLVAVERELQVAKAAAATASAAATAAGERHAAEMMEVETAAKRGSRGRRGSSRRNLSIICRRVRDGRPALCIRTLYFVGGWRRRAR